MFLKILLFLSLSISVFATTKVVVIDTGLNIEDPRFKPVLCKSGHKSFVGELSDTDGHGTHIVGLIKRYARDSDYCIVVVKYYEEKSTSDEQARRFLEALRYSMEINPDFVNYSGGGYGFSFAEGTIIRDNRDVQFVFAAGNYNENIDEPRTAYYPAAYDFPNVLPIGNWVRNKIKAPTSNYGHRVEWEIGTNVESTAIGSGTKIMSGTSQAAAIRTGCLVYEKSN